MTQQKGSQNKRQPAVVELLAELRRLDIRVWAEDGHLCYSAPEGALTPELRAELSGRKDEVLSFLSEAEASNVAPPEQMPQLSPDEPQPLSFAQERLWLLEQFAPGNAAYNMPAALRFRGPLDVGALESSLNAIVQRHDALRTTFPTAGAAPVQSVAPRAKLALSFIDLGPRAEAEREPVLRRVAAEQALQPFDLTRDLLLRATLIRAAPDEHVLLLTMHHIVSDGWSLGVLLKELATFYDAATARRPPSLPALPVQYVGYAVWQRQQMQGERLRSQLAYWERQLSGAPPVLSLHTDKPRPAVQTYRGASQTLTLGRELSEEVSALAQRAGATPFMVLLAAFAGLLARYSGQTDVVVGSPVANRRRREVEGLIGLFVNTLALRVSMDDNPTFSELLARVRETTLGAYEHQDVPFEKVVEHLNPQRDLGHSPVFQVMFVFQNDPLTMPAVPGLSIEPFELESRTAKFDLTLTLAETGSGIGGTFEYNTDLFEPATVERFSRHFLNLLVRAVAEPERPVLEIPFLLEDERRQLAEWNSTRADYPPPFLIHQLFEEQAARTPEAVAVVSGGRQLTYAELNRRADRLADRLRELGAGPEVLVGVLLERSVELVVGLLGVLKAGAAYVPLDLNYPAERVSFILQDTRVPLLLSQRRLASTLPAHEARLLLLEDLAQAGRSGAAPRPARVHPANTAYVIYTSGSTGRPKGVAITHGSASGLLRWCHANFSTEELSGVLAATSVCFDLSVFELFAPLTGGGTVILVADVLELAGTEAGRPITLVNTVPSALREVLRVRGLSPSVRVVNLAGEPLPPALVRQLYEESGVARVFNLYGPSEDTTYSTCALMKPEGRTVTIGRPVPNTYAYVLDARLEPVPPGVPGELYLGGEGLARGYLNRPAQTAERFLPDPFGDAPGARMYRTGDAVLYLPDGELSFLGRLDRQVKVRGFRIEPGEIEAALNEHPEVSESVVMARRVRDEDVRLAAYVVAREGRRPSVSELREMLSGRMPDYMVPSVFVMLDALPLLPNGKLDAGALPDIEGSLSASGETYVAPASPLEEELVGIWRETLGVRQLGVNDNFFSLGGHSLLATQLVAVVKRTFHIELPVRSVFERPTVAQFARAVEQAISQQESEDDLAALLAELEGLSDEEVARRLASRG